MSLPEIIPSNLPQFVQNKARSHFSNSVVPSGCVLLFAESDGNGGSKLIAKNPDGSFSEVGGGGGPGTFYKCASVGTGTWSGYLATIDSTTGVWSFASTATTGLEYDRITPVVGSVYDEDCTFEVKNYNAGMPANGLVFYLPLHADPGETDETGKTLSFKNKSSITFGQTSQGITCAEFGSGTAVFGPDFSSIIPNSAGSDLTISCWMSVPSGSGATRVIGFGENTKDVTQYNLPMLQVQTTSTWVIYTGNSSSGQISSLAGSGFLHILMTFSSNVVKLYINGTLNNQFNYRTTDKAFGSQSAYYPMLSSDSSTYFAAFRIYNRALDSTEISALATEFSPTPAS